MYIGAHDLLDLLIAFHKSLFWDNLMRKTNEDYQLLLKNGAKFFARCDAVEAASERLLRQTIFNLILHLNTFHMIHI